MFSDTTGNPTITFCSSLMSVLGKPGFACNIFSENTCFWTWNTAWEGSYFWCFLSMCMLKASKINSENAIHLAKACSYSFVGSLHSCVIQTVASFNMTLFKKNLITLSVGQLIAILSALLISLMPPLNAAVANFVTNWIDYLSEMARRLPLDVKECNSNEWHGLLTLGRLHPCG